MTVRTAWGWRLGYCGLLCGLLVGGIPLLAADTQVLAGGDGTGQLGAAVEWQAASTPGAFYKLQRTVDDRLFLTPNEGFFPRLGLTAEGAGACPDIDNLNGGKSFDFITNWDATDQVDWGIWAARKGPVKLRLWTSGSESAEFTVRVGGTERACSVSAGDNPHPATSLEFSMEQTGPISIELVCAVPGAADTRVHLIEIAGDALRGGGVLRKRWRPAAAHVKFFNQAQPDAIRLWVMEMDAVPGELGFYSPITTPFGYYGPTWKADGTVNTGFNFSLWSYGRQQAEPPIEQLSHLTAIGNRTAGFGHFGHEGTGVKIRDWEPLAGRQGQRQAIALRVAPGKIYDTYYSYFYAADQQLWRLFGIGNKAHGGKLFQSLWVGSFVEVPGPPPRQRTGIYERTMRYRGWVMDDAGRWYPLDRMSNGNIDRATGRTHTTRGVTDDGWMYLRTGGWKFYDAPAGSEIAVPATSRAAVPYLGDEDVAFLTSVPSSMEVTAARLVDDRMHVHFTVQNLGTHPEVVAYWGAEEGLTFAERWSKQAMTTRVREGANEWWVPVEKVTKSLKLRLLLRHDEGQFWTPQTVTVTDR